MVNSDYLSILAKGIDVWNEWREENLEIQPDLSEANLRGADLRGINFSEVDLKGADLREVNFSEADLSEADLSRADLSRADLSDAKFVYANLGEADLNAANLSQADLVRVQALKTNFQNANLTGACITDWYINHETQFDNIICEYIYLKFTYQDNKIVFIDRRPHDPNEIITPENLAQFIQPSRKTIDLIFDKGIDWSAFLKAFQNLQIECVRAELSVQAIEKKDDGSFVIRLDIPDRVDKDEIEKSFRAQYNAELKKLEAVYREKWQVKDEQIEIYKQQNVNMIEIVKVLAARDIRTVNIHAEKN